MKTVFTNDMVAHVWAQRSQDHGRNSSDSLYFHGDIIYSYGDHFPIARFVDNEHGTLVLYTSHDYSVTTSQHKSKVRRAIYNERVIEVDDVLAVSPEAHEANGQWFRTTIDEALLKAKRARKNRGYYLDSVERLSGKMEIYSDFFDLGWEKYLPDDDAVNAMLEQRKAAAAERREALKRKKEQLAIEQAEAIEEWRRGERDYLPYSHTLDIMLRVKDDEVQSSWGARFPASHAKAIWKLVSGCMQQGKSYKRPHDARSIRAGYFTIDAVTPTGTVKAGCHTVDYDEVERLARSLGFI